MRKVCLTISKRGKARFISHLDLYRAVERALRRAFIPIAFTEGYNPHPKISFLTALELGATSDCEKAIISLTEPLPPEEIKARLNRFFPQGISVEDVSLIERKVSAHSSLFLLKFQFPPTITKENLEQTIAKLMESPLLSIRRERKGKVKDIDLKKFVKELKVRYFQPGEAILEALVLITPQGSVKPKEIAECLASFLPGLKLISVHREKLFLEEM